MSILFKHKINWKYAIGEVILIFIGITLAISFNNWNEERKELNLSKVYINEIYIDLKSDINNLKDILDQLESQYHTSRNSLNILSSSPIHISDSLKFWNDLLWSCMSIVPDREECTWDELSSSGKKGAISDDHMWSELDKYYGFYNSRIVNYNQSPNQTRFELRNQLGQSHDIDYINKIHDVIDDIESQMFIPPEILQIPVSKTTLNRIIKNERIRGLLSHITLSCVYNLSWFRALENQAESIISYMEENYADIID